jgi:hypothetical protein
MENRDKDMSQGSSGVSKNLNKSDKSADFGQNIGRSEEKLNEPISRRSGSVGDSGMESGSSDLGSSKSSDLGSSGISSNKDKSSTWSDSGKSSRH